jgi:eukaryotic-like serine/threonine-protein kinase
MSERTIFLAALDIADPAGRSAYLERACGGDAALRRQVEALLAAHRREGSFLDVPALAQAGGLTAAAQPEAEPGPAPHPLPAGRCEGPGTRVGPYKLLQQIGEGGMGVVWMAEQEQPVRRRVALKVIKPGLDSEQVLARFEAERQALAMMDHQNIARVLDTGTTDSGRLYFVMELVHGVPITQFCDENKLTPRQRLGLFVPVCQAIQHAHHKGVIHRDVKPSNVLVTLYDDRPVPKVIDFGVAKATEQRLTERTLFTQFGALVGTFEYMSPEQAEMNAFGVDTRSDVYSLGVLLYELLTGTTPLERKRLRAAALDELVRLIREEEPPRPSVRLSSSDTLAKVAAARQTEPAKLTKLVRGELDWIVMKCLEKDRARRYETANGLARDVQRYLADEPVEACPPSAGYKLRKFAHKYRTPLRVAGAFVLVLVAAVIVSTWQAVRATLAETDAREQRNAATELAAREGQARRDLAGQQRQTQAAKDRAEKALTQAQERSALLAVQGAQSLIEQQHHHAALLFLARGLESLPAQATDLEHYLRLHIGGLRREVPVLRTAVATRFFVRAVAFSPDGKRFLASSTDMEDGDEGARLWDSASGKPVGPILSHKGALYSVAFHPGGKMVLTGGGDGMARLWDVAAGKPVGPPLCHPGRYVACLAFSPDGKLILTGGGDLNGGKCQAQLWETATGQPLGAPLPHPGTVYAVAFSADGKTFLTTTGSHDAPKGEVRLWETATRKRLVSLPHPHVVRTARFHPGGKMVLTGCLDGVARLWDAANGKPVGPTFPHQGAIFATAFSPDGTTVLTAGDGAVRLWEADSGRPVGGTLPHAGTGVAVAFRPDGGALLVAGLDVSPGTFLHLDPGVKVGPDPWRDPDVPRPWSWSYCRVWELPAVRSLGPPLAHAATITAVAFSPDGSKLLTASGSRARGEAQLWDVATARPVGPPLPHNAPVRALAFSPDGKRILTGGGAAGRGEAQLWDTASGKRVGPALAHKKAVDYVAFSPDGKTFWTRCAGEGGRTGAMAETRRWDVETGKPIGSPVPTPNQFPGFVSPDGKYSLHVTMLFQKSPKWSLRILDATSGKWIGWDMNALKSATGLAFFSATSGKWIGFLMKSPGTDAASGAPVRKGPPRPVGKPVSVPGPVRTFAVSPGGKTLLFADGDQVAYLWDVAADRRIGQPLRHRGVTRVVAFSPDGKIALTGGEDNTARLWHVPTGRPLGALPRHPGAISFAAFSPDGRVLLTAGADRKVRLWQVPAPLQGDVRQIVRWVEVSTGMALSPVGEVSILDSGRWQTRLHELKTAGWALDNDRAWPHPTRVQKWRILPLADR